MVGILWLGFQRFRLVGAGAVRPCETSQRSYLDNPCTKSRETDSKHCGNLKRSSWNSLYDLANFTFHPENRVKWLFNVLAYFIEFDTNPDKNNQINRKNFITAIKSDDSDEICQDIVKRDILYVKIRWFSLVLQVKIGVNFANYGFHSVCYSGYVAISFPYQCRNK